MDNKELSTTLHEEGMGSLGGAEYFFVKAFGKYLRFPLFDLQPVLPRLYWTFGEPHHPIRLLSSERARFLCHTSSFWLR